MEETKIQFETAKLAIEKGYEGITFNKRAGNGELYEVDDFPTQSLLQKWLRDKKFVEISIKFEYPEDLNTFYYYEISNARKGMYLISSEIFNNYEETLEVALLKALKLI